MARLVYHFGGGPPRTVTARSASPGYVPGMDLLVTSVTPTGVPDVPPHYMVFVISGRIGDLVPGGFSGAQFATAEVVASFGNQMINRRVAVDLTELDLRETTGAGHPFVMIVRSTNYSPAEPLNVWGRIREHGTPTNGARFSVHDVQVHAFDFTELQANGNQLIYQDSLSVPGAAMPQNVLTTMYSATIPAQPVATRFLLFFDAQVVGGALSNYYSLRFRTDEIPFQLMQRIALSPRGLPATGDYLNARSIDCIGGLGLVDVSTSSLNILHEGLTGGSPGGTLARYHGGTVMGFPLAAFDARTMRVVTSGGTNFFGDQPNGGIGTVQFDPEIGPPDPGTPMRTGTYSVLASGVFEASAQRNALCGLATTTQGYITANPLGSIGALSRGTNDRAPIFAGASFIPRFQTVVAARGLSAFGSLTAPWGDEVYEDAEELTVLGFYQDDDVPPEPDPPPAPGPRIKLSVGYPSLGLANLNELPFAPDAAGNEDLVGPEIASIEAEAGHRYSWPVFTKAGKFRTLTWSRLTFAELEQLEAFVQAQKGAAFKSTIVGETTARAFAVFPPEIRSERLHGTVYWRASMIAAELLHVLEEGE